LSDELLVDESTIDGDPVTVAANRQHFQALQECIGKFPDVYQSALRLHYWLGTSVKEIAEVLGVPENSVKSYLYRARCLLVSLLKERGFVDE
jgi:RNA polymerase sigma-70 factor (ECF subfamily)